MIIGGGCRVPISDIRQQLETAGIDMTDVEISEALSVNDTMDGSIIATDSFKREAMQMAIRANPDPDAIDTMPSISPKRDFQPRFKFNNVRKIRK